MKKKFLSLMMAAAVVATTSVSAFAAEENQTYTIGADGQEHQVKVTGNVSTSSGQIVPGTITVTVPTAMSFTINKNGEVEGAEITVTNNSDEKVEVIASEFIDTTKNSKITVVPKNNLSSKENSDNERFVSLTLTGSEGNVSLGSEKTQTGTGLYKEDGTEWLSTENPSLGFSYKNNPLTLTLSGEAKKGNSSSSDYTAPAKAIQDNFTLKLKIKKGR